MSVITMMLIKRIKMIIMTYDNSDCWFVMLKVIMIMTMVLINIIRGMVEEVLYYCIQLSIRGCAADMGSVFHSTFGMLMGYQFETFCQMLAILVYWWIANFKFFPFLPKDRIWTCLFMSTIWIFSGTPHPKSRVITPGGGGGDYDIKTVDKPFVTLLDSFDDNTIFGGNKIYILVSTECSTLMIVLIKLYLLWSHILPFFYFSVKCVTLLNMSCLSIASWKDSGRKEASHRQAEEHHQTEGAG